MEILALATIAIASMALCLYCIYYINIKFDKMWDEYFEMLKDMADDLTAIVFTMQYGNIRNKK